MRGQAIAEIAGSLLIAVLTGLCACGGLAFGTYACLGTHVPMKVLGVLLLFFGVENLPIAILWGRQTASEIAWWSDSVMAGTRRTPLTH